jgi:hypothetical protein
LFWHRQVKKKTITQCEDHSTQRSDRTIEDAECSKGLGIATTRVEDRVLAAIGMTLHTQSRFGHHKSVLMGGVLLAIPALMSQGLSIAFKTYGALPRGYYGLEHIILLNCFMALCRIKNAEQLKTHPPGELGKLLGLDRVPEVGSFRNKLHQILNQGKAEELHTELFKSWMEAMPELIFYIDGHVRVYHGKQARLTKRYVSREKLCLHGTTEFWINDCMGMPLMVITGELSEKLKQAVEQAIIKLKEEIKPSANQDENAPLFTLVFDRESYEPAWFKKLWDDHKVAIITYRKNIKEKWDESGFKDQQVELIGADVTMHLCEMGTAIKGEWFREVRKLNKNGHQTAILTTHLTLTMVQIAVTMFARWTQENYFKYMIENYDLDKMIEYGTQPIKAETSLVNPAYRQINYQLKKTREKKRRIEANIFEKLATRPDLTLDQLPHKIATTANKLEQLNLFEEEENRLLSQRKLIPSRITIDQMDENLRYNKLKVESKRFKNAILMMSYRAETTLYNTIKKYYKRHANDGRIFIKKILTSDADLTPDYLNRTLTVTLHSLATPRDNQAAHQLCQLLTETETIYPNTDLKLIYKTVAVHNAKDLVV